MIHGCLSLAKGWARCPAEGSGPASEEKATPIEQRTAAERALSCRVGAHRVASLFAGRLLFSPRRVTLPVAGHDASDRLDRVDNFGQAELGDLRPHGRRVLVG